MTEPKQFLRELEKAFNLFNKSLFAGRLEPVGFSIQSKKKVGIRWSSESGTIVIGSDVPKLDLSEIPGVLLHEMIHVANHQENLVDVKANQYHNKYFLHCALDVGLVVIKHKTQGWAITGTLVPRNVVEQVYLKKPTKENAKRLSETFGKLELDKSAFKALQSEIRQKLRVEKPPKTYFLKYQCNCPPPHNSIRSGRRPDGANALNIQCQNCRSKFECVTSLDD